jgi:MoaA/NifB/PqqE/SkfB family radical SAM enzyme
MLHSIQLGLSVITKIIRIKYFDKKMPMFGSADITSRCNLKCKHCYWWLNRKPKRELTALEWRRIVRDKFIKNGILAVSLTGGEPLLRPDVIEAIVDEMKWRDVNVVTNGTLPLIHLGVEYIISIDGTEKIHNKIRGENIYEKIKQNIINHPEEDVILNMTINRLNHNCVEKIVTEWIDFAKTLTFQFHTPFSYTDELWLPFGNLRNNVIDKLLKIKEEYPYFIANTSKQLNLFRSGEWSVNCPTWFFFNLDSAGNLKQNCMISNTDEQGVKPLCQRCGIGCYAGAYTGFLLSDSEWVRMLKVAKRVPPFKKIN